MQLHYDVDDVLQIFAKLNFPPFLIEGSCFTGRTIFSALKIEFESFKIVFLSLYRLFIQLKRKMHFFINLHFC